MNEPDRSPTLVVILTNAEKISAAVSFYLKQQAGIRLTESLEISADVTTHESLQQADVVLLDVDSRYPLVADLVRSIRSLPGSPGIIVLTTWIDEARPALQAGADAFISKSELPGLLLAMIRRLTNTRRHHEHSIPLELVIVRMQSKSQANLALAALFGEDGLLLTPLIDAAIAAGDTQAVKIETRVHHDYLQEYGLRSGSTIRTLFANTDKSAPVASRLADVLNTLRSDGEYSLIFIAETSHIPKLLAAVACDDCNIHRFPLHTRFGTLSLDG